MKKFYPATIPLLFLAVFVGVAIAEETSAITGARMYAPGSEGFVDDVTIVIQNGMITAVGRDVNIPSTASVVDANGRIVTPAFMNSATHLGLVEVSSVAETIDYVQAEGTLGAAFDIQYGLNPNSELVRKARAEGLAYTVSYPAGSDSTIFSGLGAVLRIGSNSMTVERSRAALYTSVGGKDNGSRAETWMALRQWLDIARLSERERQRLIQTESFSLKRDLDIIKQVVEGKMPLVVETHRESDIRQAVALADDYGIRVILQGGIESWTVAELLATRGIPLILDPTLNLPLYFDRARARDDTAAILSEAGVLIAFSVSGIHETFNAGLSLREAAGIAVANGLGHSAAIQALTENPAKIWGLSGHYGAIAAGQNADLIIWDGDPFEPATSIVRVYIEGREVSLVTRQTRLRDRYHPKNVEQAAAH